MEHTLPIPGAGLKVSPIALGCTKAGTRWSGKDADRLLDHYLDHGGNVLDTARIYGLPAIGRSEEVIGEWLARSGRRSEVVVLSKGGHPNVLTMHKPRMSQADMEADLTASLRALQTDCIDVYFYHRDDVSQPVGELLERMEGFRREGKIRFYACSNWTADRLRAADEYAQAHGLTGFVGNECLYNYGADAVKKLPDDTLVKADAAMLAYHRSGTQNLLMPYSSLCEGFFHKLNKGGMLNAVTLKGNPYYSEENLRRMERLRQLQEKYHATLSQVLLGYLLTRDVPMLPLVGCSSIEHLDEMLTAADLRFDAADF